MYTLDDIGEFVAKQTGVKRTKITPESRLVEDFGLEGDDFFELEHAFAQRFKVDMSGYRWYFHHAEEGVASLGALFFPPRTFESDTSRLRLLYCWMPRTLGNGP